MKPWRRGNPIPEGWESVPDLLGWIRESAPPEPPKDGKDGEPGPPGKDGEPGPPGPPGRDGKDGADGHDGRDGRDGKDGKPGKEGKSGPSGRDGKDGIDGRDGIDGVGIEKVSGYGQDLEITLTNGAKYRHVIPSSTPFGGGGGGGGSSIPGADFVTYTLQGYWDGETWDEVTQAAIQTLTSQGVNETQILIVDLN
jgi:hypothetical protein